MPIAQVVGDPNDGGGLVESPPHNFFFASQKLVSVNTSPVTDHADHTGVKTANGSSFFRIGGLPVNFVGNADTCTHVRVGTAVNWFIIQS